MYKYIYIYIIFSLFELQIGFIFHVYLFMRCVDFAAKLNNFSLHNFNHYRMGCRVCRVRVWLNATSIDQLVLLIFIFLCKSRSKYFDDVFSFPSLRQVWTEIREKIWWRNLWAHQDWFCIAPWCRYTRHNPSIYEQNVPTNDRYVIARMWLTQLNALKIQNEKRKKCITNSNRRDWIAKRMTHSHTCFNFALEQHEAKRTSAAR